jgi:hypothetical protein
LTPGSYTFIMNDSYGDGLSYPANGNFSLKLQDANQTVLASGGGNFGSTTGPLPFTIN